MTTEQVDKGRAAEIRAQLDHPVIDADGHWLTPVPVFEDFLAAAGGTAAVDLLRSTGNTSTGRYDQRSAPLRWMPVNDARDWATADMPALLHDRLDEIGLDISFVYPTSIGMYLPQSELRLPYVRAYNTMVAELFGPFRDRLVPIAVLPSHTPDELIAEARFVTGELGLHACVLNGNIQRPVADPTATLTADQPSYIDSLALDSPYDYEPAWAELDRLGLAVTTHGGSMGWDNRRSGSNYVFNHLGHFAQANHTFARALFMAGVPQRHPDLRFLFLEGGVGWAANLLVDLVGHWEKRSRDVMLTRFAPDRLAKDEVRELIQRYGKTTFKDHLDEMCRDDMLSALSPKKTLEQLTAEMTSFDFDALDARSKQDVRDEFSRAFYFGCEADDPLTALAFDERLIRTELKAVLGSDIGHWDVLDMSDVLVEAFEVVDDGLLDESQFRRFTFSNAVAVHTSRGLGPYVGTILEDAVRRGVADA